MVRYILHIRQYTTQLLCMPVSPDFLPRGSNILPIKDKSENCSQAIYFCKIIYRLTKIYQICIKHKVLFSFQYYYPNITMQYQIIFKKRLQPFRCYSLFSFADGSYSLFGYSPFLRRHLWIVLHHDVEWRIHLKHVSNVPLKAFSMVLAINWNSKHLSFGYLISLTLN